MLYRSRVFVIRVGLEKSFVVVAAPEEVLYELRKAQVYDALEQVVYQFFTLNAIGARTASQTLDYVLDLAIGGTPVYLLSELLVQFVPSR